MKGITFGECVCGKRFRSYAAAAVHRHNFPALCRQSRRGKRLVASHLKSVPLVDKP
jgi:hypothetical protein